MLTGRTAPALPAPTGDKQPGTALASVEPGQMVTAETAQALVSLAGQDGYDLPVQPFVTDEYAYLPADEEESYVVAQASTHLDEHSNLVEPRAAARFQGEFQTATVDRVDLMDVS